MARVNVEAEFFGEQRLSKLMKMMGWSRQETVGALILLWHGSQGEIRVDGSASEIMDWAWLDDPQVADKFISAACACKYLVRQAPDSFFIKGNDVQLAHLESQKSRASKGGIAKHQKWLAAQEKMEKLTEISASSTPEACPGLATSLPALCPTEQSRTEQNRAGQSNTTSSTSADVVPLFKDVASPQPTPKDLATVWNDECRDRMRKIDLEAFRPGSKRWDAAKARLKTNPDLEYWRSLIQRAAKSKFIRGMEPSKQWRGNFDWFIRPDTEAKIREGTYDGKDVVAPPAPKGLRTLTKDDLEKL